MLSDMQVRANPTSGENCYIMALNNVMDFKGFTKFLGVWKMCGLFYSRKPGKEIGELSPRDTSIKEELKLLHGIDLYQQDNDSFEEIYPLIHDLLKNGQPVVAFADAFELPYHASYQRGHVKHCITLLGEEKDGLLFLDHHHKLKGVIKHDTLNTAMSMDEDKTGNVGGNCKIRWISCEHSRETISPEEFFQMIRHNRNILNGDEGLFQYEKDRHDVTGLKSAEYLLKDMRELAEPKEEHWDMLYHHILFVANSRYLFSHFLLEGASCSTHVAPLAEMYRTSAQTWKLVANMALKGQYVDDPKSIYLRLMNKIREACGYEQQALEISDRLLNAV